MGCAKIENNDRHNEYHFNKDVYLNIKSFLIEAGVCYNISTELSTPALSPNTLG